MNILNIAPTNLSDKHGIASWFRYYFKGLIESNHDHDLYFVSVKNTDGIEKEFTDKFYHYVINWKWEQLNQILKHKKWDIIHWHTTVVLFEDVEFEMRFFNKLLDLKSKGTKIITTTHSLQKKDNSFEYALLDPLDTEAWHKTFNSYILSEYYNTKISEMSDVVVYISKNDMKEAKLCGDNFENSEVIYNSMNIYKDFKIKDDYKKNKVGFSHRFAMRKNWMTLLDLVPSNKNKTFHLSGEYFNPLVHTLLMKESDNVIFHGVLDEVGMETMFETIDVMLCPATYEPFGFTALESVILGTPALIYKDTGTYEVLGDSSFNFTSEVSISQTLNNFYSTPNEEIKERVKSQQAHLKKFSSLTFMVDEYLSLYSRVMN